MNCHRVQNLLSAYLDQELSSEERRLIRNHIFNCPLCSQNYEELNKVKSFLGNLEPPTPEIDPLVRLSLVHHELLNRSAHYNTLLWGKRLLLTGSCVFLFLLTSFSLFPVTGPTGVTHRQEEVTPFVQKPTRYQFTRSQDTMYKNGDLSLGQESTQYQFDQQQNPNLLVNTLEKEKEEEKEREKIEPWPEDSLRLPVIPVSR